jgi:hypothetical protein
MYGGSGAGKKAMPFASYGLFLSRDLITIFSSFTLPKMLAKGISSSGAMDPVSAQACAQMVSPVAMQGVCAPVHLLALNMYNAPVATCVKSKFHGAFALNRRVDLHAIDATHARWRGDAGSS